MRRGGEPAHVYACLRQNHLRTAPGNPGHLANLRNGRLELRHVRFRHPVQLLNAFVQVIDVVEDLRQQSPLQRCDDPIQSRHDFIQLGQETFVEQLGDLPTVIHCLSRGKPFQQALGALTVDVRHHAAQLDVGALQHLLQTVHLSAALFDDALTVAGQFPQLPLFPAGDEACPQKAVLEQLRDPLRVIRICLASWYRLHVGSVNDHGVQAQQFEQVVQGLPVRPRTLHGCHLAACLRQPVSQRLDLAGHCAELPQLLSTAFSQTSHDEVLVHVDPTTAPIDKSEVKG